MKFAELNDEQKKEALERYRLTNVDCEEWDDFLRERLQSTVVEYGFNDITISVDASFCQGSGASFVCDDIDIEKYLRSTKQYSKYRKLHKFIKDRDLTGSIGRTSYRYNHSNTVDCTLSLHADYSTVQESLVYDLQKDIIEYVRRECDAWHHEYENVYMNYTSDKAVQEAIEANEYDFEVKDSNVTYL